MIGLQAESIRSAWSSIGICVALASTAAFSAPSQTWPHFHGKPVIASRFTPWGELAEKGRALVGVKYTWEAVAKTMVEGYERVGE